MPARFPLLALAVALVAAPARADETPVSPQQQAAFADWLNLYRAEATARGLKPEWLDTALSDVKLVPRVIDAPLTAPAKLPTSPPEMRGS